MKMTHIAYIYNNADAVIAFERFTCKKLETVKRNMEKLLSNDLYRVCTKGAEKVKIYCTPDGYNREENPVLIMDI